MKDLYQILGVEKTASDTEIKKAYRELAMKFHPDKGGNLEKMQELAKAYEELGDKEKRVLYDQILENPSDAVDAQFTQSTANEMLDSHGIPFSTQFKKLYVEFSAEYQAHPAAQQSATTHFTAFKSDIYHVERQGKSYGKYSDIFSTVKIKEINFPSPSAIDYIISQPLDIEGAIDILIDFLEGDYYGSNISVLRRYVSAAIEKAVSEKPLYESIVFILAHAEGIAKPGETLMLALKQMTDYIKNTVHITMPHFAILLQNKYFRNFYSHVLHVYWQSNVDKLDQMAYFNGQQEGREELIQLIERARKFSHKPLAQESLQKYTKFIKLLYCFDKDIHAQTDQEKTVEYYQEHGYRILDWLPAFLGRTSSDILANILIQSGLQFQLASQKANGPIQKMTNERMAFLLYMNAIHSSHHSSLDAELYSHLQCLKYIADFKYTWPDLQETIPLLQKRCLYITDVFPLIENEKSNFNFLTQSMDLLGVMRRLLHVLVEMIEKNKYAHPNDKVEIDHAYVSILYQAYEACLKNWYQEEYDPQAEQKIKITLMKALLKENKWQFDDLDKNIKSPWVMIGRNSQGWLKGSRSLPIPNHPLVDVFSSVNGLELDYTTGEVVFLSTQWDQSQPENNKVLTLHDLQEMLEKNVGSGLLSLDPVDRHKDYHPYNQIRISPTSLYQTHFLQTMLLTDCMLKFLTVGHEVRGEYPYDMQPVENMLKHMPLYLQKIVYDFHKNQQSGSIHRFWIEARQAKAYEKTETVLGSELQKFAVPEIEMVVRKKMMRRDASGNLIDQDEKEEGWQIYVQKNKKDINDMRISGPAMIFLDGTQEVYLIEDEKLSSPIVLNQYEEKIRFLCKQIRDPNGLIPKKENNNAFIYHLIKSLSVHLKKPHYFSAEYVFAQEFTAHYNEFAQYLPEFERLRQLSRITVFITLMNSLYKNNQHNISKSELALNNTEHWQDRQTKLDAVVADLNQKYNKVYTETHKDIQKDLQDNFNRWRLNSSKQNLLTMRRGLLAEIKSKIGTLDFTSTSPEVIKRCDDRYEFNKEKITNERGLSVWYASEYSIRYQCNAEKGNVAKEMTRHKRESINKECHDLFADALKTKHGDFAYNQMISNFIDASIEPLAEALVNNDFDKAVTHISELLETISKNDIILALNGDNAVIARMATQIVTTNLSSLKEKVDVKVKRASEIVPEEKSHIQSELNGYKKLHSTLMQLGIGKCAVEIDLKEKCLWVPASVHHEVGKGYSRLVYGGVHIAPSVSIDSTDSLDAKIALNAAFTPNHVAVNANDIKTNTQSTTQATTSAPMNGLYQIRLEQAITERLAQLQARGITVDQVIAAQKEKAANASSSNNNRGRSTASSSSAAAGGASGGRGRSPSPPDEYYKDLEKNNAPQLFVNKFPDDKIGKADILSYFQACLYMGELNYVVLESGDLIVGRKRDEWGGGHIDLANGKPVLAAGEFKNINGKLKFIDNSSGHYLPTGISARRAAENAFIKFGFKDIAGKYIEKAWDFDPKLPRGGKWRPKK